MRYMLRINVEGASAAELRRGLDAARAVFAEAGIDPARAAEALWNVEGWDINGFQGDIDPSDLEHCDIWLRAEQAAIDACTIEWGDRPRPDFGGVLEIVPLEHSPDAFNGDE